MVSITKMSLPWLFETMECSNIEAVTLKAETGIEESSVIASVCHKHQKILEIKAQEVSVKLAQGSASPIPR